MKRSLFFFLPILTLFLHSCYQGESVDTIIHNAKIHSMDEQGTVYEAIAIKDGKIIEVGPERQILNKYSAEETIDAQLRDVYPGFTDAHGHIMSYAKQKISVDLVGCRSYDEMIVRIEKYQGKHKRDFIIGRGWDQSLWGEKELPNNKALNEKFPNTPVCLFRIDGHAILANDAAYKKAKVLDMTREEMDACQGGYYVFEEDSFTGVAVDNAMNKVLDIAPEFPQKELKQAILEVQMELYGYGITGVHEAGLEHSEFQLFDQMVNDDELDLNIYGMLLPTGDNLTFAKKNGIYENQNLLIRSIKVYGDGAMGSRGAFMKQDYSDHHGHQGYAITDVDELVEIADFCEQVGYQMNTHAIGDSANLLLLKLYEYTNAGNADHRWRIEHCQVVDVFDFARFMDAGVFPSVQPTHAVSDQRWAESRIGEERMKGAYAYKMLLEQFGMLAIGTDFPVESPDPFATIHAAVNRKDKDNQPAGGFIPNQAITMDQCIRGMTVWAAYAGFQEKNLGTLEEGKDATLVIFDKPVVDMPTYQPNFAYTTLIKGKKVYTVE